VAAIGTQAYSSDDWGMSDMDKIHMVCLEIGHRNDLTRAACLRHVSYFKEAKKKYPDTTFGFSIGGYYDDACELIETKCVANR
jgi:hypothetical protein